MRILLASVILSFLATPSFAHDTWVQTNANLVRVGDVTHVDLMLGNHGNEHRDFKLASKITLDRCTLAVIAPGGQSYDIQPDLIDTGYAPKEGYWTARFVNAAAGLYTVSHTLESSHGTTRTIKSGKTYFVASPSLDDVSQTNPGFEKPLGHALELVPLANPVTPMGPGQPIRVKALYQGRPLVGATVAFIPRGAVLAEGFDATYERKTDTQGAAEFTPKEGNYYLVAVHHDEPDQKGEGYDRTHYSATLTVYVPQLCPCCGE